MDENSGALDDLVKTMEDQGLKDDLAVALDALQDYCDRKVTNATIGSVAGAGIGAAIGLWGAMAAGMTAAVIGGVVVGIGSAAYLACRAGYWNNNEDVVDKIEDDII